MVGPDDSFVVSDSGIKGKLAFPMIPGIDYQDITDRSQLSADMSRVYMPGSFLADLKKEDIQTIFWGPEGKPEASHPKTEQGDLPWMLFWDGYTVHGRAFYDGQGQLIELTIWGEKGRASFELELRLGDCPLPAASTSTVGTRSANSTAWRWRAGARSTTGTATARTTISAAASL